MFNPKASVIIKKTFSSLLKTRWVLRHPASQLAAVAYDVNNFVQFSAHVKASSGLVGFSN
jgi:hypothetical protein